MKAVLRMFVFGVLAAGCMSGCRSVMGPDRGRAQFDGRMLVAVSSRQAERIARSQAQRISDPSAPNRWRFTPIPAMNGARSADGAARQWVIAEVPRTAEAAVDKANPWDVAHRALDGNGRGPFGSLVEDLSRAAGGELDGVVIEPDFAFLQQRRPAGLARKEQNAQFTPTGFGNEVTLCDKFAGHWPRGETVDWHLSDEYSQLHSARELVRGSKGAVRSRDVVRIAVIDTGYNEGHITTPPGLNKAASRDFSEDPTRPRPGAADPYRKGKLNSPGHGTAVISVLAGGRIKITEYGFEGFVGGVPDYEVVMYRISDSVIHFFPSAMAMAIKYAVAHECDVISLSHGGLPSKMLADAVNEAYENGTAVFAAAGDFMEIPVLGWTTPQSVVYPAAFDRVVAVTGATADLRSYGRSPGLMSLLLHWDLSGWMLRGSYGPDAFMHEAIAGYAPNVMWARYTKGAPANLLDLDGRGTSAATPQVAAAAALWLEYHKNDPLLADKWRSWEKAEAVYLALFDSAEKNTPEGGDSFTYFGRGLLKARDALDLGVPKYMEKRRKATVGFGWLRLWSSFLPGVRSVSPTGNAAVHEAHAEMACTELAQLVHLSQELQDMVVRLGLDPLSSQPPDETKVRAFLDAVSRQKQCSSYLRKAIRRMQPAP